MSQSICLEEINEGITSRKPGLTSLVDVVFILLIFFMLSSRMTTQYAWPISAQPLPARPEQLLMQPDKFVEWTIFSKNRCRFSRGVHKLDLPCDDLSLLIKHSTQSDDPVNVIVSSGLLVSEVLSATARMSEKKIKYSLSMTAPPNERNREN